MKRLLAAIAAAIAVATGAYGANTAKAVVLDGGKTMRFVYDDKNYGSQNTDWFSTGEFVGAAGLPLISAVRLGVERVEFDHSFRAYKPTSCKNWFLNFRNLKTVAGTCNLDVSQTTDLLSMFGQCQSLTRLDLSTWDTSRVTNFRSMFNGCSKLTTIYATDSFKTSAIAEGNDVNMFSGCTSLVGGAGLTYDESRTHAGYAQIDSVRAGGGRKYGYFTQGGIPVAVLSNDGSALTFYCDTLTANHSLEGTVYPLYGWNPDTPPWMQNNAAQGVFSVSFSPSFAIFRPHSCREWFANLAFCNSISGNQYLHTEDCSSFAQMFANCVSLPAIDMSSFDTSSATDMREMFRDCSSMIALNLATFDTSRVTDMSSMFTNCVRMTALDISGFDTSRVADMGHMFEGCNALRGLEVGGFDTSCVTNMSCMFAECRGLSNLDLSGFDTSHVTDMSSMFKACQSLRELDLSGFDTSSVTSMSRMFWGCYRLNSLDVSGFNTSNVTEMDYMFAECIDLSSLDLRRFDTSKVTIMDNMFDSCRSLGSLDLYGFDTSRATRMHAMFYQCESLKLLNLSSFDTSRVTNFQSMFAGCSSLTVLDLSSFKFDKAHDLDNMFQGCKSLTSLNIAGFNPKNISDSYSWFWCIRMFDTCLKLETIYVASDYSLIGKDIEGAQMFYNCLSLVGGSGTTFDPDHIGDEYARIDRPSGPPGYFTAYVPPVAVYSPADKTLTFYFDGSLHISAGKRVYSVDEAEAINPELNDDMPWSIDCRDTVTNVIFDASFAKYHPKHCGKWFRDFSKLEAVTGIENLDVTYAWTLFGMFNGCSSLRMLDLSGFNTPMARDMGYMFYGCTNLVRIIASENFTTSGLMDASDHMFGRCTSLMGSYGTAYSSSRTGADLARIDIDGTPGYFASSHAVAVYSSDASTLIFYADSADHSDEGTVYPVISAEVGGPTAYPPWYGHRHGATNIVFDASFANYRPRHCGSWFRGFDSLTGPCDLKNLDVSAATSLEYMFAECTKLKELDISSFDTRNVKSMKYMFWNCPALVTIEAGDTFTTAALTDSGANMFNGCYAIVGMRGTEYDPLHLSSEYARIDAPPGAPGYFGKHTAVAVHSASSNTLTFYYDTLDHSAEGTVYYVADAEAIDPEAQDVPWHDACHATVTDVVFDKSFAKYRPSQCGSWFYDFSALVRITGIKNLNVSEATNLKFMFCACTSIARIDVSRFDTGSVTSMKNMFYNCPALRTIEASERFTTAWLDDPDEQVFGGNTALVGGRGTEYNVANRFATYARIDASDTPGYFTAKRIAVAAYTKADSTLTFYCDYADHSDADELYDMEDAENCAGTVSDPMPWVKDCRLGVRRVVFDNSFSYYRPRRCTGWFRMFGGMERIYGLDNLDVSEAIDLSGMFDRCVSITELDFTRFDTHSVTSMARIVNRCHKLKTIYASDKFVTTALADPTEIIFNDCPLLTGGIGTAYDGSHKRWQYAHVDSYSGNPGPGYFTSRNPVAVLSFDGKTLTFYADGARHLAEGQAVYSVTNAENLSTYQMPPWYSAARTTVTNVVFDKSFRNFRPNSCAKWFQDFAALTSISRISNLDVSRATSLNSMFYGCSALTTLGLELFDTGRVTDMGDMFRACTNLRTIYASTSFTTDGLSEAASRMFIGCSSLVGGNGTAHAPGSDDSEYACIDGSPRAGYLSSAREAVAVYADKTLTFYYDGLDHSAEGEVFETDPHYIYALDNPKPWRSVLALGINTVVFDISFADYRPKDCEGWFQNCIALVSVMGLENLDVSKAKSLQRMFSGCTGIQSLDLSGFDTRSLTFDWSVGSGGHISLLGGCASMFAGCSSLKTIYASESFAIPYMSMHPMFTGCGNLKGGNGTACNFIDSSYARVDSASVQGYFTRLEPVAVYSDATKTLTFHYDGRDHSSEGTVFSVARAEAMLGRVPGVGMVGWPPWRDIAVEVEKVVFSPSFANYRPIQCALWFEDFTSCTDIAGLKYLDVSRATSLQEMFSGCENLNTLDLTGFDTANVRVMEDMLAYCGNLETIYATDKFTTRSLTSRPEDEGVFEYTAESVVGGNGTSDVGIEATFARIDRPGAPGYFTEKVARAVYSFRTETLTFYYDTEEHPGTDESTTFLVADAEAQDPSEMPPWYFRKQRVVFDPSFADYRPKHCGNWFAGIGTSVLEEIQGIQYLDVSAATSLRGMFLNCNRLKELDLTGFNTANVKDMCDMFSGCTNLVTIYVSEGFTTESIATVGADRIMFRGCAKLVGGNGTSYTGDHIYVDYAHIDTRVMPGYFTDKATVQLSGYEAWALDKGLTGDDAAWNAKPAMWGGKWENAFIYTYGEGIIDGSRVLLDIYIDEAGEPVILTAPVLRRDRKFQSTVIGTPALDDWSSPVFLDPVREDTWMLKKGDSANFFRLRMTK